MEADRMNSFELTGRKALVTGGARGIGAATAEALAHAGASVMIGDVLEAEGKATADAIAKTGATAGFVKLDVTDEADWEAAIATTIAELGGLDVVVNNTGVAHIAPIDEFPAEEYDRVVGINIGGMYWTVRSAIKHLGEGARIINIGSINADRVPGPGLSVYAMTKGAVSSLTRGLARELGPRGITVNNVQPGPIDTDANPDEGEFAESLKQVVALGRYGHVGDVAAVVSFLAGPESGYVTGANWNVDGGFTV